MAWHMYRALASKNFRRKNGHERGYRESVVRA